MSQLPFKSLFISISVFASLLPRLLLAHSLAPTVDLKVVSSEGRAAAVAPREKTPMRLYLALIDKKTGRPLRAEDLVVVHERKFHLFGFDQSLGHYIHLHPVPVAGKPGVWQVPITFGKTGYYHLWADIQRAQPSTRLAPGPADAPGSHSHGNDEMVHTRLRVLGDSPPDPAWLSLPVKLKAKAGHSIVRLADVEKPDSGELALQPDETSMILLFFERDDGRAAKIVNYLGAPAHVTITNLRGDKIIHVHPMVHAGKLMLHTSFPEAGDYKLFLQFLDRADSQGKPAGMTPAGDPGDLKTVELVVHVRSDLE